MNEREWVRAIVGPIQAGLNQEESNLVVADGQKLIYAYEISSYADIGSGRKANPKAMAYETDILISEQGSSDEWKPRLIIEAKINSVTTHDAITYSQKAATHKNVHPYLRYGILIGNRRHYPLPGRLFRHGAYFDFMLSWRGFEPLEAELKNLIRLILAEVEASRNLEEILFKSRDPNRRRFTLLHRPLVLQKSEQWPQPEGS